jgi:glutamyl-tRNA synthetase
MLHVGALRDALFKSLFAQHEGGQNVFRIEDTDRSRYNADSESEFVETLRWVGIEFDEGPHIGGPFAPYRQSERKEAGIYAPLAEELMARGHAYKAFETSAELDEMREFQQINKMPTGYFGGAWRDATPEQVAAAEAEGKPFVIRQRIPRDTKIVIDDVVRGRIEWDSNTVDDPVLIKADGMPTYHFAAMVDDHLMQITHILRGEEWISSAPKHALLFDAFGWERPIFCHCPVIVGSDGKKLSKRHGATRVLDYMAQGFFPHALKNFIALIGWSPGDDREAMTMPELIGAFELKGIQASPGRFDFEKLRWLNGNLIRSLTPEDILDAIFGLLDHPHAQAYWENFVDEPMPNQIPVDGKVVWSRLELIRTKFAEDPELVLAAIREEQPRVHTLVEFGEAVEFFLVDDPVMDEKAVAKWLTQPHVPALFAAIAANPPAPALPEVEIRNHYDAVLRAFAADNGFDKLGPVVHPTRVALTGKTVGPGLFELMAILGPDRTAARLAKWL